MLHLISIKLFNCLSIDKTVQRRGGCVGNEMCGVRWFRQVSNESVKERCNKKSVVERAEENVLKRIVHMERMTGERLTKKIYV